MSIFNDMKSMHHQYGVHEAVANLTPKQLTTFMQFRLDFLKEELDETNAAFTDRDPEEIVDGLIDLIVIAAGTLDLFGVNGQAAWDEVLRCNKAKEVGIKPSRPNPLGLPDLIKPSDWKGPQHGDNRGRFSEF